MRNKYGIVYLDFGKAEYDVNTINITNNVPNKTKEILYDILSNLKTDENGLYINNTSKLFFVRIYDVITLLEVKGIAILETTDDPQLFAIRLNLGQIFYNFSIGFEDGLLTITAQKTILALQN